MKGEPQVLRFRPPSPQSDKVRFSGERRRIVLLVVSLGIVLILMKQLREPEVQQRLGVLLSLENASLENRADSPRELPVETAGKGMVRPCSPPWSARSRSPSTTAS